MEGEDGLRGRHLQTRSRARESRPPPSFGTDTRGTGNKAKSNCSSSHCLYYYVRTQGWVREENDFLIVYAQNVAYIGADLRTAPNAR